MCICVFVQYIVLYYTVCVHGGLCLVLFGKVVYLLPATCYLTNLLYRKCISVFTTLCLGVRAVLSVNCQPGEAGSPKDSGASISVPRLSPLSLVCTNPRGCRLLYMRTDNVVWCGLNHTVSRLCMHTCIMYLKLYTVYKLSVFR